MGKHVERVFKKNSLKVNAASQNNTSWYTDAGGFPEQSLSRKNALQWTCPPQDNSGGFFLGGGISSHTFAYLYFITMIV